MTYSIIFTRSNMRQQLKGNNANTLINKVQSLSGVTEWGLFKNDPRFHSTTQFEYLVKWWGVGSYWFNKAAKDSRINSKLHV